MTIGNAAPAHGEAPAATDAVDACLAALDHPRTDEIRALRSLLLASDPRVREEVKWNAPSFRITDHFATFKLRPRDTVQVVLHTGAKARPQPPSLAIDDPRGLLTWPAKDRAVATFPGPEGAEADRDAFAAIVRQWIAQVFGAAAASDA